MSDPSTSPLRLSEPPAEDLFDAVEEIRAEDYSTVPADLLAAVLTTERDHLDDRLAATRTVGRVIDAWLDEHAVEIEQADTRQDDPGETYKSSSAAADEEDRS